MKEKAVWARFATYLYRALPLSVGYGQMLRNLTSDTGGPISQLFWKLLFGALSIGSIGVLLAVYYAFSQGMALMWQAFTPVTVLLLFPALLFLRQYAFYSPVWSKPGR